MDFCWTDGGKKLTNFKTTKKEKKKKQSRGLVFLFHSWGNWDSGWLSTWPRPTCAIVEWSWALTLLHHIEMDRKMSGDIRKEVRAPAKTVSFRLFGTREYFCYFASGTCVPRTCRPFPGFLVWHCAYNRQLHKGDDALYETARCHVSGKPKAKRRLWF